MSFSSSTSSSQPKFRVAICGGGPGGLTLAVALSKFNSSTSPLSIDLYESQPEVATVGAGIAIWLRTQTILKGLGIMDALKAEFRDEGGEGDLGIKFRKCDEPGGGYDFYTLQHPVHPLLIHRSALLKPLELALSSSPSCTVHTSKKLVSYSYLSLSSSSFGNTNGPITLHFTDGTTAETDILIGADGIRSSVRRGMFGHLYSRASLESGLSDQDVKLKQRVEPRWSGTVAYRALITKERLEGLRKSEGNKGGRNYLELRMPVSHLVVYPISRGTVLNIVAFVTVPSAFSTRQSYPDKSWVKDVDVQEFKDAFDGFEDEVGELIQAVDAVSKWAIHIHGDMPRYVNEQGNVAILGDAAHAMETHLGTGAGQAMEDGYLLARLLTHPLTTLSTLPTALKIYERIRLPFVNGIVNTARRLGELYEFEGIEVSKADLGWVEKWGEEVKRSWGWQWEGDAPERDWKVAEGMLKEALAKGE
ncbi:FAD/NAD-P-binding domain-containing protein [Stereum hirsutum FP-91666 SS1]|uniref:FAD/NAD-P-binding domain-containing protein n=1 Tax=Stereum hirsutum (strain FP-91666) TaxID=721885 RepID=UPI000440ADBF|nr:FAD/NAD-P-binding domain-containing protein [Stereum hirsutum FP-91666 SS1]EIM91628.1 FAD/NAD-P-binding domain-containing protein [Stereum hirsutum FP-91666 SS1]